ncbi:MAG: CapA family protein [Firmicutes bacterium]|nr:CapA family protein [Bacillota bacterium]
MVNKLTKILLALITCVAVVLGVLMFSYKEKADLPTVTLTGDLYYDKNFISWIEDNAIEDYFEPINPLMSADYVIGNLVQTIGKEDKKAEEEGEPATVEFPNSYLEAIAQRYSDLGFNFFTCANAQSNRKGFEAIENTNKILDSLKLGHTGINSTEEDMDKLSIAKVGDARIAILSYTAILYDNADYDEDDEHDFSVNMLLDEHDNFDSTHKRQLKNLVAEAKEKADIIVVAMNWGEEYTYEIDSKQMVLTNYLNSLGVDMIIGNHPHIAQKADILTNAEGKKTYVFYSLGSLITARVAHASESVDETGVNMAQTSAVVQFDLGKNEEGKTVMENVRVIPVVNHYEKGYKNFQLIPLSEYTSSMASKHAQHNYTSSFSPKYLWDQYHALFDATGMLYEGKINVEEE